MELSRLRQAWFSVLELVVAMVIASLLAGIALSHLGEVRGQSCAETAMQDTQALVGEARAEALIDVPVSLPRSSPVAILVDIAPKQKRCQPRKQQTEHQVLLRVQAVTPGDPAKNQCWSEPDDKRQHQTQQRKQEVHLSGPGTQRCAGSWTR